MLPTVFLSLSGHDEAFVRRVHDGLPDGLAYFYPRSFENGENLVEAMEERIGKASVFVLFASKASVQSKWVGFEIDRARIAKIKSNEFRVLVFPIERDLALAELPMWMREHWVGSAGLSPKDIARYIRNVLSGAAFSRIPGSRVYGRGPLVDETLRGLQEIVLRTNETPNIIVVAGTSGIGRRTLARAFLDQAFPSTPELTFGPQLHLPQFADIADLYRSLRQEVEPDFSISGFQRDLEKFAQLSTADQVAEITRNVEHFSKLGQAVTIVTGNGIYEDRGLLKQWVPELFRQLANIRKAKLVVISNRLLHANELRPHPNVMQLSVPALQELDTRALMISMASSMSAKPELPNQEVIRAIGGHPGIAKTTTAMIARKGVAAVNNDLRDLFSVQDEVLSESLDFASLTAIERDALSLLSWVPQLDGTMLRDVLVSKHGVSPQDFAEAVSNLILACLVEVSGPNYLISGPVRTWFRRKHGYGSNDLRRAFSSALRDAWERARNNDEMRNELFDALIYMTALEGGSLPSEFSGLLLPSTLQEVVRDTYDRGHDDDGALRRVVSWGLPAMTMRMDETTREEILSYVVRAQTRLQDIPGTEKTLQFLDEKSYRSRFYLRSFFVRHCHNDTKAALFLLKKAFDVRKYMGRVVADLGVCYQRLGMWPELHELIRDQARYIDRNPALLDVQIGMWITSGDFPAAETGIRKLRSIGEQGRADGREAAVMMKRDQNYRGAQSLLTALLQRGSGAHTHFRRLRAIAAAQAGDFETARADAKFLTTRPGGIDAVHHIEARIKLAQGDFRGAEQELERIKYQTGTAYLLKARILEGQANDVATPLDQRDLLRKKVAELRARYRMADEFQLDQQ